MTGGPRPSEREGKRGCGMLFGLVCWAAFQPGSAQAAPKPFFFSSSFFSIVLISVLFFDLFETTLFVFLLNLNFVELL
jgi:hypothetical protein